MWGPDKLVEDTKQAVKNACAECSQYSKKTTKKPNTPWKTDRREHITVSTKLSCAVDSQVNFIGIFLLFCNFLK